MGEKDSFGNFGPTGADRAKYGGVWIAAPALLVALVAHPTLNGVMWSDVAWTFLPLPRNSGCFTSLVARLPSTLHTTCSRLVSAVCSCSSSGPSPTTNSPASQASLSCFHRWSVLYSWLTSSTTTPSHSRAARSSFSPPPSTWSKQAFEPHIS